MQSQETDRELDKLEMESMLEEIEALKESAYELQGKIDERAEEVQAETTARALSWLADIRRGLYTLDEAFDALAA